MRIIRSSKDVPYSANEKDHVDNKRILSFICPICHNKSVYDTDKDVYRPYEVGYDDLCVCEECGAELYARPQYDGTIQFESDVESCNKVEASSSVDTIKSRIYEKASSVMETFGFPKDEVDDYLFVEVDSEYESEYFDGPRVKIEVRAELDFDALMELADELNPIVESIDPDAYFDAEDSGILVAFIDGTDVESCESINNDVMSSSYVESSVSGSDIETIAKAAVSAYDYDDIIKVLSSLKLVDKSLWNKYNSMLQSDDYSIPYIGKCISDDLLNNEYVEGAEDIGFNDWLLQEYGISSDDMTDEDYDNAYNDYQEYLKSCESPMLDEHRKETIRSSKYKRVAKYNEFDNGHVMFDYSDMDDETAEGLARDASINDPDDVYYVKYDDVMNPDSDYRWYRGNKYNWSDIKYKDGRYQPVKSAEDHEFDEYEDEIKEIDQEFTSENTSINSTKLPAVFKLVSFEPGTVNIDYGGGRFDNVADYLSQYDVINLVYDPYNRTPEHNKEVIRLVREHGGADTATCSNVLNVIKEPEVRMNVLNNIKKLVKSSGEIYITVYEGTGKGDEGATKSGYQLNRKTNDYLEEIQQVFPDAKRKGKLIIAHPSGSASSATEIESASYGGAYDIEDDMFFTRDDINEFGYQVAALFSEECGEEFELSDVYMDDPVNLHIQVSRDGIDLSADVKIDMRRIRSPRDLDKYADSVIDQLHRAYQEDYLPYVSGSSCGNCKDNRNDYEYVSSNVAAGSSSEDYMLDGSDEVMAGWYDPPEYDEPYEVDPEDVEMELILDADIEIDDDGDWTYLDDSYPWIDETDLEYDSFSYPVVELDDKYGVLENVDDLLYEKLPDTPGKYHIKGRVVLTYSISGISYTDTFLGKDEDGDPDFDREYYMDDVKIEWVRDKSRIENFEFDRIR